MWGMRIDAAGIEFQTAARRECIAIPPSPLSLCPPLAYVPALDVILMY
jgi:hypothetical protein